MTSRSPTLVTIDTSMRRRSLALAIWRSGASRVVLALSPESPVAGEADQFGDLRRRRQLLAAVEGGKQRHAHQDAGGHAGEESAGKPARGNLAPIRRPAAPVGNQRRLVAEFGYGLIGIVHSVRRLFPGRRRLIVSSCRLTFACHGGRSQRNPVTEPISPLLFSLIHQQYNNALQSGDAPQRTQTSDQQWGRNAAILCLRRRWPVHPANSLRGTAGRNDRHPRYRADGARHSDFVGCDSARKSPYRDRMTAAPPHIVARTLREARGFAGVVRRPGGGIGLRCSQAAIPAGRNLHSGRSLSPYRGKLQAMLTQRPARVCADCRKKFKKVRIRC